jgi:hypothetical protein
MAFLILALAGGTVLLDPPGALALERHPCAECHLGGEAVARTPPAAWRASILQTRRTACPVFRGLQEQVFNTEVRLAKVAVSLPPMAGRGIPTAQVEARLQGLIGDLGQIEAGPVRSEADLAPAARLRGEVEETLKAAMAGKERQLSAAHLFGLLVLLACGLGMAAIIGYKGRMKRQGSVAPLTLVTRAGVRGAKVGA